MLIFDMDGTLIDSNGVWREVDIAFLKKRGFPYTKEYYQGVAHTIFPKAAVFTKAYCNLQESTEEIMAEWMEMAGDAYATRVPAKPGVRAYLDQCRRKGERMIVLTSAVPAHCRSALTHLGLMEYFETIFFAHDLNLDKKDPDIFLLAAKKCGVHPADCTLYDDSVDACMTHILMFRRRKCGPSATAISTASPSCWKNDHKSFSSSWISALGR